LSKAAIKRLAEIEAKGIEITDDELHEACRMAPRWSIANADKLGDLIFAYGREGGIAGIPPECRESCIAALGLSPDQWRMSDVSFTYAEVPSHIEAKGLNIELACAIVERLTRNPQAVRSLLREYANPSGQSRLSAGGISWRRYVRCHSCDDPAASHGTPE
jgi:hypothetical protein